MVETSFSCKEWLATFKEENNFDFEIEISAQTAETVEMELDDATVWIKLSETLAPHDFEYSGGNSEVLDKVKSHIIQMLQDGPDLKKVLSIAISKYSEIKAESGEMDWEADNQDEEEDGMDWGLEPDVDEYQKLAEDLQEEEKGPGYTGISKNTVCPMSLENYQKSKFYKEIKEA